MMLGIAAHAQSKIGTIDMQKVFDAYHETLQFELDMQTDPDMKYLEDLDAKRRRLTNSLNDLIQRASSVAISEATKGELQEQGRKQSLDLRQTEDDIKRIRRKIEGKKRTKREEISSKLMNIVSKYGHENGYDMLIDSSGSTLNGIPTILFAKPGMDQTEAIIAHVNEGQEEHLKEIQTEIDRLTKNATKSSPAEAAAIEDTGN